MPRPLPYRIPANLAPGFGLALPALDHSGRGQRSEEERELEHGMILPVSAYPQPPSDECREDREIHRPAFPGYRCSIPETKLWCGKPISTCIGHVPPSNCPIMPLRRGLLKVRRGSLVCSRVLLSVRIHRYRTSGPEFSASAGHWQSCRISSPDAKRSLATAVLRGLTFSPGTFLGCELVAVRGFADRPGKPSGLPPRTAFATGAHKPSSRHSPARCAQRARLPVGAGAL